MPLLSVEAVLEVLRTSPLLRPAQQEEFARADPAQFADARAIGQVLLERGWLTPFQINHLVLGKVSELFLGAYVLQERLGDGAQGVVYKALHQRMNRVVALKVIRKELLADPQAVERFYREVEVASQLSHDNIVHAYDAGPIAPTHFLAMEFVPGNNLEFLVRQAGPLPVARACSFLFQAALGLQYASEHGLAHFALKPSKLLVAQRGAADARTPWPTREKRPTERPETLKIVDLGLAHSLGQPEQATGFQAPEQAARQTLDARTDIYSLGCIFWFLLTGQPPATGSPRPLEEMRPDVPPQVVVLVKQMLAPDPADRPQTAADVAHALQDLVSDQPGPHDPASDSKEAGKSSRWRWFWLVVVGCASQFASMTL